MKPGNTAQKHLTTAGAILSLLLAGCQSETLQTPDTSELYTREFIKKFGIGSLDHEWNTATRIVTDVDRSLLSGATAVKVYTCWPGNPDCEIVASYDARTGFEFDYPSNLDRAYVQILDSRGKALYAEYCPISNGHLQVAVARSSRAAEAAPVYAYDLSTNRGLGTIPVDKEYNSTFWKNFTTNSGNHLPIDETDLKYPDFTPLNITEGKNSGGQAIGEEGFAFDDNWGSDARIDYGLPTDMSSNTVILELTYSTPAGLTSEAVIKFADDNWKGYKCTGVDGIQIPKTDGEKKSIEITAEGIGNMKGNTIRVQGLNYTIYSLRFKGTTSSSAYVNNIFSVYGLASSPVSDFEGYRNSYIKPDYAPEDKAYSAKDLVPFVGSTGVFKEEVDRNSWQCNLEAYRDLLQIDERMDFIVGKDQSEVSIDYMFGSTSYFNSFGYFYYTDAEATLPEAERMAVLLKKPKFLLMYDACPFSNLYSTNPKDGYPGWDLLSKGLVDGHASNGDALGIISSGNDEGKNNTWDWAMCKRFADYVSYAEQNPDDTDNIASFRSAKYRLVYYAPDQFENGKLKSSATGSYKFPLGTHIAFFVVTGGQYILERELDTDKRIDGRQLQFSVPLMNKYMGNTMNQGHSHSDSNGFESNNHAGAGSPEPWTPFVAYQWNGQTIMGVEDGYAESENGINGSDHDMNDMLLRVNGEFVRDREELNPDVEKPTPQSWIIACEDLGGSHDFDFNDVVFGVSHIAGEPKVTVTALAAGGTLPVYIEYNGTRLIPEGSNNGELHSWWGAGRPHSSPINAHSWGGPGSMTYEITGEGLENFTLTDISEETGKPAEGALLPSGGNMGGFKVIVEQADGTTTAISAPVREVEAKAPQMFLAPRAWLWPSEGQCIDEVYNGFIHWTEKWWGHRDGINASNIIFHTWRPGQE